MPPVTRSQRSQDARSLSASSSATTTRPRRGQHPGTQSPMGERFRAARLCTSHQRTRFQFEQPADLARQDLLQLISNEFQVLARVH